MSIIQIIGLVVVLILAVLGGILIWKKSKEHSLVKWVGLFVVVAVLLTWIFGYGYYSTEFVDAGMDYRQGLTDIPYLLYQAIRFSPDKIIFLLVLGAFYAVLTRCNGYKKLVHGVAEKLKGKEILAVILTSLIFTTMASLYSQSFVCLIFVPFMISVLLEMKLDKITAFAVTFGSILIGTLGVTYGNEGLYYFDYYTSLSVTTGLLYRLIILVVAFVLFNFFTVLHVKKIKKENVKEEKADLFLVEKPSKKAKSWPYALLFIVLFIFVTLGYIRWEESFGITVFNDFNNWLTGLSIGSFPVFKAILGSFGNAANNNGAFGYWNLFNVVTLMLVITILLGLFNRIKFNEFITSFKEGFKKMGAPITLYLLSYMVMFAVYSGGTMTTVTNDILKLSDSFNPYLTSLSAFIANIFHADFGLTGYNIAAYLVSTYSANVELIHTIYTTLYGFVGLFVPTSGMLLIGLSYLNIDYKTWLKYIWLFLVGILVILLVLFTVMAYI